MPVCVYTNNAFSTLASGITSGATTLSVGSGHGARFPTLSGGDYTFITLTNAAGDVEIVKVTARSSDSMTIERAQDGTTARAWSAGDRVELRVTRALLSAVLSERMKGVTYQRDDDGNISGGTWAIDYANGPAIVATATANITSITMANWPASGTAGHLKLFLVNFGAYTITFPSAWKFVKGDLTLTTTFGELGLTLPASGLCILDLVSIDGGTTIYATFSRN